MQFFFNEKILLNDAFLIYCKITGTYEMLRSQCPFVLVIPGGPGFGHHSVEPMVANILKHAPAFHFILFDPLGCGESDKSEAIINDYTPQNFAEMAAQLVEAIQLKLNLPYIDLRVLGRSAGGMTALLLPKQRPIWVTNKTQQGICLTQIFSIVGLTSFDAMKAAYNRVGEKHGEQYTGPFKKLLEGNIINQEDYFNNIAIKLGPLYSKENEKLLNSVLGKLLAYNYTLTTSSLSLLKHLSPMLRSLDDNLTGCSLDVINNFFKQKFDVVNIETIIKENYALYNQLPTHFISATEDYIASHDLNSEKIRPYLQENASFINLISRHSVAVDAKNLYEEIIIKCLTGALDNDFLKENTQDEYGKIQDYKLAQNIQPQMAILFKKNKYNVLLNEINSLLDQLKTEREIGRKLGFFNVNDTRKSQKIACLEKIKELYEKNEDMAEKISELKKKFPEALEGRFSQRTARLLNKILTEEEHAAELIKENPAGYSI